MEVRARKRNARGSGNLLRAEILAAAGELLDATGRRSDLTLRQIAGAAGISAPAIYAHFADREAILAAVAEQGWQQVVADIKAAADPQDAARERLLCGCRAYLAFAQQHPARYALMTETVGPTPAAREALGVLTRALAACQLDTGAHPHAARIAAALSTALHGAAMLNRTDAPSMWLSDVRPDDVLRTLVDSAIAQQNSTQEYR
ncbi:TetR/AcrR family transcriptional regulator [Mycolicibacterium bacteremicum]|uniref:TetR/AcrR family transcriptional regulator n=1 Tax=Mycolicibacterium bacteremicum TaxID=564198 RepID=UPI0026EF5938|nr:TetR/AcrR family transcriptional regulator [Mycolicibacterium bacteremicum]